MFWIDWVFHASASYGTNTGLFPLKHLLHYKRSPAQNLWSQEKEIRLESTHLSSAPHTGLRFISSSSQISNIYGDLFWHGSLLRQGLHFLHFSFCLLISQPWHTETIPGPFLKDQVLEVHFGEQLKQRHGQIPLETSAPLLSFCSHFSGLLQISQTGFLSFHFHPVYFHTALCCHEDSEMFSEQKKQLLLFPFTPLRVPHESLCVFLNHPSRFLIVQPGFSASFHKHV